jgi:hypothetical protein
LHDFLSERFWVDLILHNPLDAEVNLSNLTIVVEDANGEQVKDVEVEVVDAIVLGSKETQTVRCLHIQSALLVLTVDLDSCFNHVKTTSHARHCPAEIRLSFLATIDGAFSFPRSKTARDCTSEEEYGLCALGPGESGGRRSDPQVVCELCG